MLDHWEADLSVRQAHTGAGTKPTVEVRSFRPTEELQTVWRSAEIRVSAILVRHEPVVPAVGYRVDSPEGAVAISGDTIACAEVERLSEGVELLIHEALLSESYAEGSPIREYHTDAIELGRMAARIGVPRLVLTHLVPSPMDQEQADRFAREVRAGGYDGDLTVGRDLDRFALSG